ncbi:hypothetical protein [Arthrobacter sp. ok362]|uniref:hypothetical protein n=1 Tax=Arthrobacter sp. ok362 TaxID=1761745 RepID=UPI000881EB4B|nr:hypothetical protein [Arthrobacter sp. ok362]SDL82650.1 hypothetical protein SAMN04487913_11582 [Arthrobacter sp. ok362]
MNAGLSLARAVADAVLYEGYLLYPYRASSAKNQARWQFGVLGPPGAAESGAGEEPGMAADCLLEPGPAARVDVHLRFLHLQTRSAERADDGGFTPAEELIVGPSRWLSWDEATDQEITLGPYSLGQLAAGVRAPINVPATEDTEPVLDADGAIAGRLVRRRRQLRGELRLVAAQVATQVPAAAAGSAAVPAQAPLWRLRVTVENTAAATTDKRSAIELSFIGAHVLLAVHDADFLSVIDPPEWASAAAASCRQHRCWPVLAGPEGQRDVLLLSPIILYDHPAVAPESTVELFDATEIDEILTLRVLTLTDEEKAEARSTDARAAAIIDRCENMTAEELQQLHGILRNPHAGSPRGPGASGYGDFPGFAVPEYSDSEFSVPEYSVPGGDGASANNGADTPWWDPARDAAVDPESDTVFIDGVPVSRGSRVRVVPLRRADAQDLFFAGKSGRVTGVHFDVDGGTHVAVVLEADPAAELQEWYGRYLYFAPEELVPLAAAPPPDNGKEPSS